MPGFTAQACIYPSPPYRHAGNEGGCSSGVVAASTECTDDMDLLCHGKCYPDTWHCEGDKCVCHSYGWTPPPPPATTSTSSSTEDWYSNEALRKARFGY